MTERFQKKLRLNIIVPALLNLKLCHFTNDFNSALLTRGFCYLFTFSSLYFGKAGYLANGYKNWNMYYCCLSFMCWVTICCRYIACSPFCILYQIHLSVVSEFFSTLRPLCVRRCSSFLLLAPLYCFFRTLSTAASLDNSASTHAI